MTAKPDWYQPMMRVASGLELVALLSEGTEAKEARMLNRMIRLGVRIADERILWEMMILVVGKLHANTHRGVHDLTVHYTKNLANRWVSVWDRRLKVEDRP